MSRLCDWLFQPAADAATWILFTVDRLLHH